MAARTSLPKRFNELIERGKLLLKLPHVNPCLEDRAKLEKWKTTCLHLVGRTFGEDSIYYEKLRFVFKSNNPEYVAIHGMAIMEGAKEDIEKGFLYEIKHLIATDTFDSILEQAEHLLSRGFKDAAAIIGRVVIENSLKDIANRENIEFPEKANPSGLNQILWKEGIYAKNVWRVTQGHIDTENFAAHGHFDKYNEQLVKDMLKWTRETILNL